MAIPDEQRTVMVRGPKGNCFLTCAFLLFLSVAQAAYANGEITTREEATSTTVAVLISTIGGALAILGIFLAAKRGRASSTFKMQFGKNRSLELTRLTQGVVIVIIGAAILIAGLYNLPKVKKEETIKAKTIEEEGGKKVYRK